MNCVAVRDRLTEHALGALPSRDATGVDRHLQWCAACRKESGELDRAAATLAFSLAPAEPPPELEDRVVETIQAQVGSPPSRTSASPRRGRLAVVATVAAMVALSGLSFGAVMAGRLQRSEQQVREQTLAKESAVDRFAQLFRVLPFSDPNGDVFIGTLSPSPRHDSTAGGSAFTLVSPSIVDMAVVMVNGLPPAPHGDVPYTVRLTGPGLATVKVGVIGKLDSGGAAIITREFKNLSGYDAVTVRDAGGRLVLRGTLATRADLASPSP